MQILPLKYLSSSETNLVGKKLIDLSLLSRGLAIVPEGFVVVGTEDAFIKLLKKFQITSQSELDLKKDFLIQEINNLKEFAQACQSLPKSKLYFYRDEFFKDSSSLVEAIFGSWIKTLRIDSPVLPQVFFLVKKVGVEINAFLGPKSKQAVIKSDKKLSPQLAEEVEKIVIQAQSKLLINYNYRFIFSDKLYLVGLQEFIRQDAIRETNMDPPVDKKLQRKPLSTIKLFFENPKLTEISLTDGFFIETDAYSDSENLIHLVDEIFKFHAKPTVIINLPDQEDDVSGACLLIHKASLLIESAKSLAFLKNNRKYRPLLLSLPRVKTPDELSCLKRELASLGLDRGVSLQFWLNVESVENILNIEEYESVGLDGVIVNLDKLHRGLYGYRLSEAEFYKNTTNGLIGILTSFMLYCHKKGLPVIAQGQLSLSHLVLDFLVAGSLHGIIINSPSLAESLPDQLSWIEKRAVINRADHLN